jgi:predicted ester cyclase
MGTSGTRPDSTRAYHLIRRIFEEGFVAGDTSVVDQVCSPDLVEHQFGLAGTGARARENLKAAIRDVHRAVPDLSYAIEDCAERGDTIWVRVRVRGTATGPLFGPPSSKPVDITVFDQARVAGGLIAEHWGVPDRFALLAQTGLLGRLAPADSRRPAGE